MAKYLIQANYVGEGIKGLLKDGGSTRRAVTEKMLAAVGGKIEARTTTLSATPMCSSSPTCRTMPRPRHSR